MAKLDDFARAVTVLGGAGYSIEEYRAAMQSALDRYAAATGEAAVIAIGPEAVLDRWASARSAKDLAEATEKLCDAISRDVNGILGMPMSGNGGLISRDTIRAADEARIILSRHRKEVEQ